VVGSDYAAKESNPQHGVNHPQSSKDPSSCQVANPVANYTKGWKDQHVDLRVAEESEEVLEKDRITSTQGVKERGPEVTIQEQHRDRTSQDRKREYQEQACNQDPPNKEGDLVNTNLWRPVISSRAHEVNPAQDRASPSEV